MALKPRTQFVPDLGNALSAHVRLAVGLQQALLVKVSTLHTGGVHKPIAVRVRSPSGPAIVIINTVRAQLDTA
jgi:hypothetical protein